MIQILPPMFLFLTGLMLLLLGSIQSLLQFPSANTWQIILHTLPELIAVSLFALCLAASIIGLLLTQRGYQTTRQRFQTLRKPSQPPTYSIQEG